MRVLELQLPEPTASKLEEAAERLSLSPEQLAIQSIEEKLSQLERSSATPLSTLFRKMPTCITGLPDALLLSSGSNHASSLARLDQ